MPDPELSPEKALEVFILMGKGMPVEATELWLTAPITVVLDQAGDDGIEDYQIDTKLDEMMNSGLEMPLMFKLSRPGSEDRVKFVRRALYILRDERRAENVHSRWRLKNVLDAIAENV